MTTRRELRWRLEAPLDEVVAVLSEPADFARWWRSSWLEATEVTPGDAHGVGRIVSVRTRGRSPLVVAWSARCVSNDGVTQRYALFGDVEGALDVTAQREGGGVTVTWRWEVELCRADVRSVPFIRRVFESDLGWMMRRGEDSLRIELARRASPEHAAASPGPASESLLPWTLMGVGVAAAAAGVVGFILGRRR